MPKEPTNNSNLTDKVCKIGIKSQDDLSPTKQSGAILDITPSSSPVKPISFGNPSLLTSTLKDVKPISFGSSSFANPTGTIKFGESRAFGEVKTGLFGKGSNFAALENGKSTFGSGMAIEKVPEQEPQVKYTQQEVITGEEGEELVESVRCKLYWDDNGEWRERGVGVMKLSKFDEDKFRLVMRSDGVLKLILNVRVHSQMPIHVRNEKYIEFYAQEDKMIKFLCKCKNGEAATRFERAVRRSMPVKRKGDTDAEEETKRIKVSKPKDVVKKDGSDLKKDAKTDLGDAKNDAEFKQNQKKVDMKTLSNLNPDAKAVINPKPQANSKDTKAKEIDASLNAESVAKQEQTKPVVTKADINSALVTPEKYAQKQDKSTVENNIKPKQK